MGKDPQGVASESHQMAAEPWETHLLAGILPAGLPAVVWEAGPSFAAWEVSLRAGVWGAGRPAGA